MGFLYRDEDKVGLGGKRSAREGTRDPRSELDQGPNHRLYVTQTGHRGVQCSIPNPRDQLCDFFWLRLARGRSSNLFPSASPRRTSDSGARL